MGATPQFFAEDFSVGQTFSGEPSALSEAMFRSFADITGDAHPIHYDADYASRTMFGRPVAHGLLLTALTALGATQMSRSLQDSMVALIHQRFDYLKPAFPGDVVTAIFECASVAPARKPGISKVTFHVKLVNQDNDILVKGQHGYLLRSRSGSADRATP